MQALARSAPAFQSLADNQFHRFVTRSLMVIAVLGLWPMLRGCGVRSWADVGVVSPKGHGGELGRGLALGFGSLALVAGVALATGARKMNEGTGARLLEHCLNAGGAALLVAPLEELVFRGALFGALRRAWSWMLALIASSALFAIVHFFQRVQHSGAVEWTTGFTVLGKMMQGFTAVDQLVPAFLTLFLVGAILAWAYQITGNLYYSIGLHAGWIFWLKSYGFFTGGAAKGAEWFWGTGKLLDGWFALFAVTLALILIFIGPLAAKKR